MFLGDSLVYRGETSSGSLYTEICDAFGLPWLDLTDPIAARGGAALFVDGSCGGMNDVQAEAFRRGDDFRSSIPASQ